MFSFTKIETKKPFELTQGFLILKGARFGYFYFTASFSAFAARNLGTRIAGTEIVAPVRGFLACLAARVFVENIPRPATETSPPLFSVPTIESITNQRFLLLGLLYHQLLCVLRLQFLLYSYVFK